jgi:hypothetical protein
MFQLTLAVDDDDVYDAMTTIKNQSAEKWLKKMLKRETARTMMSDTIEMIP